MDAAVEVFHGVEHRKKGMTGFDPIPNYSGTNPRLEADGVFACTFKVAREQGDASLKRIANEKADTVKGNSQFPAYRHV